MDQKQYQRENIIDRIEEETKPKTLLEKLIDEEASLDEIIGPAPSIRSMSSYQQESEQFQKSLDSFEKKYFGVEAENKSVKKEGLLVSYAKVVKELLLGREEQVEVTPRKKGLIEEGKELYQAAAKDLQKIEETLPRIRNGLRLRVENERTIRKYLLQNATTFQRLEDQRGTIENLLQELEDEQQQNDHTFHELRRMKEISYQLRDRHSYLKQTMTDISLRTRVLDDHKNYLHEQNKIDRQNLSILEGKVSLLKANLEQFKTQVETLDIPLSIIRSSKQVNTINTKLNEYLRRAHELYKEFHEEQKVAMRPEEQSAYSKEMTRELKEQSQSYDDLFRMNEQELYRDAKKIFRKLDLLDDEL